MTGLEIADEAAIRMRAGWACGESPLAEKLWWLRSSNCGVESGS